MRSLDLGEREDWLEEPALPDGPACSKNVLKMIACPRCGFLKNVEKHKVYGRVGFSRITCMRCRSVNSAEKWRCDCELLWPECERHMLSTLIRANCRVKGYREGSKRVLKGVIKTNLHGHDEPFPQRRCIGKQGIAASAEQYSGQPRLMLKAGSLLANHFPHIYARQVNEDTGQVTQPCRGSGSDQREPLQLW